MFKTIYGKFTMALAFMSVAAMPMVTSCNDDDEVDAGADASIRYIRSTYANQADSMLTAATFGQCIAIVGNNLSNVTGITFNDVATTLNSCYVTPECIVVTLPGVMPENITNKLVLSCKNGNQVEYPLDLRYPNPNISMVHPLITCEGTEMTITGDYFFGDDENPITVTFPSGAEVEAKIVDQKTIEFTAPAGCEKRGNLSVTSMYGTTKFNKYELNNTDGMWADGDDLPFELWNDKEYTVETANGVSGNYIKFKKAGSGVWDWTNPFLSPDGVAPEVDKIDNAYLMFEVRTNKPWTSDALALSIVLDGDTSPFGGGDSDASIGFIHYGPWQNASGQVFDTKGKWQTVMIPLNTQLLSKTGLVSTKKTTKESIKRLACMFWGPCYEGHAGGDWDLDVDFDNFRIYESK